MWVVGEDFTLLPSPVFCNRCGATCWFSACCGEGEGECRGCLHPQSVDTQFVAGWGEGKNGKFAESASAYIRVGACPARRVKGNLWGVGRFWEKTREEVAKSGDVWRESRLVFFERSGGGEEKQFLLLAGAWSFPCSTFAFWFCPLAFPWWPCVFSSLCLYLGRTFLVLILLRLLLGEETPTFSFSSPAKVEIRTNCKQKHPVKLIFSAQNEISGENFSRAEEKKRSKKVVFAPKVAESDEKGRFWVGNHREGMKRKNGHYYCFCNAMK